MQEKHKLIIVGDETANVSIDVDGETIAKVNSFKYLVAIKTSTDSCSEDIKARIGRTKKATMELDTIWKDRGIRKDEIGESAHYIGIRRMEQTLRNIHRYTPITVYQTAPFQTRKILIEVVISW